MAKMKTLHDLFIEQLKDMNSAERQLVGALPKMAKAASNPELRQAFEQHLNVTKGQVDRLQQLFDMFGATAGRKKCKGMEGLIAEGDELMTEEGMAPAVKDAGLIAAAQKVEHYEIASYGTLRTYADMMGHKDASRLIQQTLDEEGQADKTLTQIAEKSVNIQAEDMGMQQGQGMGGQSGGSRSGTRSTQRK
jgi:ferritin-like metal-binding protein YciE